MMRLLLFIYPDSYPDMSGYINTYTVHSKRGMKDVKEHLIRMHTEKASYPSASSFMHIMVCYLLKKVHLIINTFFYFVIPMENSIFALFLFI